MTEINFVFLQCVFHSIRFKVNKRLEYSGTPFFMSSPDWQEVGQAQ